MSIIVFILILALIGLLVWAIVTYVPMVQAFKTLIIVAAIVLVIIWILQMVGLTGPTLPRIGTK